MKLMWRAILQAVICLILIVPWSFQMAVGEGNESLGQLQETSDIAETALPPSDQEVFNEIELSPEGVVAYDSVGNRWSYDFDEGLFVLDDRAGVAGRYDGEGRSQRELIDPVEDRCTEELVVLRPALKAVFVGYDEFVGGNIVAYGRVTVKGWVKGSVQSVNKRVLVSSSGRVDGDIKAPEIVIKKGAEVNGEQIITEPFSIPVDILTSSFSTAGIWVVFGFTLLLLLVAFLTVSLAPRQLSNVATCVSDHKIKTFFLGLLFVFLLPLIVTVLAITLIGVLVVPFLPLAYLVALTMGMNAVGRLISGRVLAKHPDSRQSLMFHSLFGVLLFMVPWALVAVLLGPAEVEGFGVFLLVLSIVATIFPLMTGVGAVVLTWFGFREYVGFQGQKPEERSVAPPAPAPPPILESPPAPPPPPANGSPDSPPLPSSGK